MLIHFLVNFNQMAIFLFFLLFYLLFLLLNQLQTLNQVLPLQVNPIANRLPFFFKFFLKLFLFDCSFLVPSHLCWLQLFLVFPDGVFVVGVIYVRMHIVCLVFRLEGLEPLHVCVWLRPMVYAWVISTHLVRKIRVYHFANYTNSFEVCR